MTLKDAMSQIAPQLTKSKHIHAMWLEGSWAAGKILDESDIDVWLDVDDGSYEEIISVFREALRTAYFID